MSEASRRPRTLSMILAGGEGKRLFPLTLDRAKPAVPFGGQYRLIDFVLSNLANGGYRKIVVLTQYKSHSLDVHLSRTWRLSTFLGNYVTSVPAQMRRGRRWFLGSADAIYQNLNLIDDERPDYVFVFGADHIYRMDPRPFLDAHIDSGAGVTVAGLPVPVDEASEFGIIDAEADGRIRRFLEKPSEPPPMPGDPTQAFASMGNYVFSTDVLIEALRSDAGDDDSGHDLGGDLIPALVEAGQAAVYDFTDNAVPGEPPDRPTYWRDVGTIDSYHEATMDLVAAEPSFDLYNDRWPIHTLIPPRPPAKLLHHHDHGAAQIDESLLAGGVIVEGAVIDHSVLSGGVRVGPGAVVENSLLLDGVSVGPGAVLRNAIIDKNVQVPAGAGIGVDSEADHEQFTVSPGGIVVAAKGQRIPERVS